MTSIQGGEYFSRDPALSIQIGLTKKLSFGGSITKLPLNEVASKGECNPLQNSSPGLTTASSPLNENNALQKTNN